MTHRFLARELPADSCPNPAHSRRARLRLGNGPRENSARPAIDPLFRSVAVCCGSRAVGAVLTGTLGDGATGLEALRQRGGMTVVQDPENAAYPEMLQTALRALTPNHVVGLHEMPTLLARQAREPAGVSLPVPPSTSPPPRRGSGRVDPACAHSTEQVKEAG